MPVPWWVTVERKPEMPTYPVTESIAKIKEASLGMPGEAVHARKILHAIEGMAASWHKVQDRHNLAGDFDKGRQQMAVQGISLLLGVSQAKVREALESKWL